MNLTLLVSGLFKTLFGALVGALGVVLAWRAVHRMTGTDPVVDLRARNTAAGVVYAATLVALGLLVRSAVQATFDAVDLLVAAPPVHPATLGRIGLYALLHVALSLAVGALVLLVGARLFDRMTPGLDEHAEVRAGNVSAALVLAAVLLVLALLTAPGLQAALDGLLPFPRLPPDTYRAPH